MEQILAGALNWAYTPIGIVRADLIGILGKNRSFCAFVAVRQYGVLRESTATARFCAGLLLGKTAGAGKNEPL